MGCTFIARGDRRPDEILDGVRSGVYVRRMETGSTDPRSGLAVFRVTDADRIRNGRIDVALKPFLLHVDGAIALASMDRIGDDLQFDRCVGVCHRDGQPLAISVGAPTIWIGLATVNG
jgi:TldD protein